MAYNSKIPKLELELTTGDLRVSINFLN